MTKADIIRKFISESTGISLEGKSNDIELAALGFDSLDIIEIVMALEDKLGIHIPDKRLPQITTLQHLLDAAQQADSETVFEHFTQRFEGRN